jgi:hypothetical protein
LHVVARGEGRLEKPIDALPHAPTGLWPDVQDVDGASEAIGQGLRDVHRLAQVLAGLDS